MNNKKFYFLFFFLLLSLNFVYSDNCDAADWSGCDFYINDTLNICLYPGNYSYVLNWSYFYDWSAGPINTSYRSHQEIWVNGSSKRDDYVFHDQYEYYYWIVYNNSFPTGVSYNDTLVLWSGFGEYAQTPTKTDRISLEYYDGGWGSEESSSGDMDQSTSCGLSLYPTSAPWSPPPFEGGELMQMILSYWTLNDSAGNTVVIDSNGIHNGILMGGDDTSDLSVAGKCSTAFDLDGSADYVNTGFVPDSQNPWSVSGWIKTTDNDGHIFNSETGGNSANGIWVNVYDHKIYLASGRGSGIHIVGSSTTTVDDGNFHFFAAGYDGSNGFVYVDDGGAEVDASWSPPISQKNLTLGRIAIGGGYFDGVVDELAFWNYSLNSSQVLDLYNSGSCFSYPFSEEEGGGGSPGNITLLQNITSPQNMNFSSTLYFNLSQYFDNWYDLVAIYLDPLTSNVSGVITGYSSSLFPYFNVTMGIDYYYELQFGSYLTNHSGLVDVFGCDNQSDIDSFCPVAGFPSTCNFSAFYTDEHCLNTSFILNISDDYSPNVTRYGNFSLYYDISSTCYKAFSIPQYYFYYDNISINWTDGTEHNLSCGYVDGTNNTYSGNLSIVLDCTEYPDYLWIYSISNLSLNTSFTLNASDNQGNYLTDTFIIISSGDCSSSSSDNFDLPFNYSSFYDILPSSDDEQTDHLIILIILISCAVFLGFLICVPLGFSKFSLFVVSFLVWLLALFFSIGERLPWVYVLVPPVLLIVYFVIKIFGGSN